MTGAGLPFSSDNRALYSRLAVIRRFEERTLEEFSAGRISGTTHASIGQEANAVGVLAVMDENDIVFSNHRCHGHFLAYGGTPEDLAAELMGRSTGICGGRGGSQHLCWRNFYSNGVLGGTIPVAAGMAFAEKATGGTRLVFAFLGDGTLGQGVVYETLNIASLWQLPIVFVLENNWYAQTTPLRAAFAGDMALRFEAFGVTTTSIASTDVLGIRDAAAAIVASVREGGGPAALIIDTYRFCAHSKGDDVRPLEEIAARRNLDPLVVHGARLDADDRDRLDLDAKTRVEAAFEAARRSDLARL